MNNGKGVLPRQMLEGLIKGERIKGAQLSNLQPGSLDLSISDEIYRVKSVFLPNSDETVKEALEMTGAERYDINLPLEVDVTYAIRLNETLALPKSVYGYANPKSSTGRNDIHVRMLADRVARFDSAGTRGYHGSLWALITPKSFRVKLSPGDTLLQLRLFDEDTRIGDEATLQILYSQHKLLFDAKGEEIGYERIRIRDNDGELILTINLESEGVVGYRCERSQEVLDFSKLNHSEASQFFQKIEGPAKRIFLRKGDFYIFVTKEYLRVPSGFAVEMLPVDSRAGEYRSHYAGYIDPGWGYGRNGYMKGLPLVLEIRPNEDNIMLRDGQPICKVRIEKMKEIPDAIYGEAVLKSNYANQCGPRLSKHFKKL